MKCPAAAPLGLQGSPTAAAFPALWQIPPSHRRLPLTQAASLPDGSCSPRAPAKRKPRCSAQQVGPMRRLTPLTSTTRKHSPCCPMGQGRHGDRDRDSPRQHCSGQGQCPGTRVWVTEGARVWSCSVLPAGMDGRMEGCSTAKPLISWHFEMGRNHWEIVELPSSPGWDGSRAGAEQAAANEKQVESPASPPQSSLSPQGQPVFF